MSRAMFWQARPLAKVEGATNPSDLLAKHLPEAVMEKHLDLLNLEFREGR